MIEKAAGSTADEVMLDLEDSVAPDEKEAARHNIIDGLDEFDWTDKVVAVRINGLGHPNAYGDLTTILEARGDAVDVIIVPKIQRAADVYFVDTLLSQIEAKHDIEDEIGIEVLIEEAKAMQNIDEIAAASDRLEALIFGPADYSASIGLGLEDVGKSADTYPGDMWHYVRNRLVIAASANGLDAIDGPFANVSDTEGYRTECERSRALGFVGKWAIHPSQIEIANETYAPSESEIEYARRILDAMEDAQEAGRGAVQLDGSMLDEATIRLAERRLQQAELIEAY